MFATIIGPLIGGVFTTELTWRWCFWINLPIGGTAIVLQLLFLRVQQKPAKATWKEILLQLDLPGFSILLVSLICFTLSLQWGGLSKPWSDGSVIATLVLWVVLTITFFVVEWMQGPYAMIPLNLIKSRIIWANCLWAVM
jgi:MFS family permease